jgi:type I restriction enzyme S subunit
VKPIDIKPGDMDIVREILARHVPEREVRAFGSRVSWTANEFSDLDLAVMGDEPLSMSVLADIKEEFENSDLPIKVDVVDWAVTKENFRKIIEKEFVVIQKGGKKSRGMAGKWMSQPLEDCMEVIIDYRGKTPAKTSFGIPLITAKVVKSGRIETPNEFIAVEDYEPWMRRGMPKTGDVVITTEAPLGEVAQLGPGRVALAQRLITLRGKTGLLDNGFLKFLMQSEDVQEQLRARASGTTVLGIKQSEIRKVLLTLPPLAEQKAIAHILGTLDDKIELNRRMNETLEQMARALFKHWFVDFEFPNSEGKPYKSSGGKMINSELGEIPKGWEVLPFADTVDIFSGGTPKTSVPEYWNGDIPWYAVGDAPSQSELFVIDTDKKITKAGVDNSATQILPVGTTIISARGTVGKLALTCMPIAMNQTCYGLRGKQSDNSFYTFFSTQNLISTLQQNTHGSIFDTITRDTLNSVSVINPISRLMEQFESEISPLMRRILKNLWQNHALAAIRDALLPKLLSGEIRINELERVMEEY